MPTVVQLIKLCRANGIRGYSRKRKAQILEMLGMSNTVVPRTTKAKPKTKPAAKPMHSMGIYLPNTPHANEINALLDRITAIRDSNIRVAQKRRELKPVITAAVQLMLADNHVKGHFGKYGDWKVTFSSKRGKYYGATFHKNDIIDFPEFELTHQDSIDLRDTILHEVAHAIEHNSQPHVDAGHGPVWQRVAEYLGAAPHALGRGHMEGGSIVQCCGT